MKRISVKLSQIEYEILQETIKKQGMSTSEIVRASLWLFHNYQLKDYIKEVVKEEMSKS